MAVCRRNPPNPSLIALVVNRRFEEGLQSVLQPPEMSWKTFASLKNPDLMGWGSGPGGRERLR